MYRRMIYYILFYVTLGFIVSTLQQLVLQGFPIRPDNYFLEEWLGGSLYLFLYIQLQRRILRSFISKFRQQEQAIPLIMKYFLLMQILGFILMMVYSILITALLRGSFDIRLKDLVQLRFIFVYFFFIHSVIYVTGIALRLYKLYIREKDAKHQAEKSFFSAQLQLLRQQLNPHFLFNNLNIIASTINSNPTLAYNFTRSMASFYRKVLESENDGLIVLKDELKTIQSYLYMLSVRFEEKLTFSIDIPEDIQLSRTVPDFILQPIVENAVKHNTCSKSSPLQIIIAINEAGNLEIKNNYQPRTNDAESLGIGWFNIESRYKYMGARAPVKYLKDGWFYVEVPMLASENVQKSNVSK
jgi:two-component system LytT family sensor kinase